jgi:hypothetical protein
MKSAWYFYKIRSYSACCWVGHTHFLTRRLPLVGAEMCLNVLAYNFKRVLRILGFETMMKAMRLAGAIAAKQDHLGRIG